MLQGDRIERVTVYLTRNGHTVSVRSKLGGSTETTSFPLQVGEDASKLILASHAKNVAEMRARSGGVK